MLEPLCNQAVTEDRLQNSVKIYSFYFKAQQRQKLTTRTAWGYSRNTDLYHGLSLWGFLRVREQNHCIIINGGYQSRQFHSLRQNINFFWRMRLGEHLWTLCLALYRCPLTNSLTVKCITLTPSIPVIVSWQLGENHLLRSNNSKSLGWKVNKNICGAKMGELSDRNNVDIQ